MHATDRKVDGRVAFNVTSVVVDDLKSILFASLGDSYSHVTKTKTKTKKADRKGRKRITTTKQKTGHDVMMS